MIDYTKLKNSSWVIIMINYESNTIINIEVDLIWFIANIIGFGFEIETLSHARYFNGAYRCDNDVTSMSSVDTMLKLRG